MREIFHRKLFSDAFKIFLLNHIYKAVLDICSCHCITWGKPLLCSHNPWRLYVLCFAGDSNCKPLEFACKNGRCIDLRKKCDGYDDCGDTSDERQCRKY